MAALTFLLVVDTWLCRSDELTLTRYSMLCRKTFGIYWHKYPVQLESCYHPQWGAIISLIFRRLKLVLFPRPFCSLWIVCGWSTVGVWIWHILNKSSATTLLFSSTWTISVTNWEIKSSYLDCDGDTLSARCANDNTKSLWSLLTMNRRPSKTCLNCFMAQKAASNSL